MPKRAVITGAFSYTGAAVARELLNRGWNVHTLTHRIHPADAKNVTSSPLIFNEEHLKNNFRNADTFINTYWIRTPRKGMSFEKAVENSRILLKSAVMAGVRRIVHVSVSNPDRGTSLGYYRGKSDVEDAVSKCGIPYAVIRPTLIVGPHDVLTNNIAWFLRNFPVFPIPRNGHYRLQPVTLTDTARLIADAAESGDSYTIDAAGPEVFTFRAYVECIAQSCRLNRWLVGTPNWISLGAIRLLEPFLRDGVLTREELAGLQQELLCSSKPALGRTSVREWLNQNAPSLGRRYANDLKRHFTTDSAQPITLIP